MKMMTFGRIGLRALVSAVMILTLLFSSPLKAQVITPVDPDETIVSDDDDNNDDADPDTLVPDSLVPDTALAKLPWDQAVQAKLNRLLESDMFKTSQVGMMVYDLDADSVVFAHGERQTLRPASTMKVITAITAIDKLGGSYQFKTELKYTGKIENHTLSGGVYCVGGFDPRFNSDDLSAFVTSLKEMGVDTICGTLFADTSMKDADRLGEGWCWDDKNPVLSPLLISRRDEFMDRFVRRLRQDSIVVTASVLNGRAPYGAYSVCTRFHTLDQILMRMLKESDNLYAESMFYQTAASTGNRPASAKSARAVTGQLVRKLGLDPARYRFADGSGLSLYNYVTAELEVMMLRYAYRNNNIYVHLYPALPIDGVDGTLKKRMRGSFTSGNVHAKTGTVSGISSLAGYCTASTGHRLAFSIINQGVMHRKNGRAFQDRVCTILCSPH